MNAKHSVRSCGASALACPSASSPTTNWRRRSTRPTSGSSSAPASSSAISPATGETTSTLGDPRGRARRSPTPGCTADDIDLIIVATSTPDYTFPAVGDADSGGARHHAGRRLRPAGGLLGLRLRGDDGRQVSDLGLAQARAGDRRRDLLAHPRLEGPHDLRAVRRRRRARSCWRRARRRRRARSRRHRLAICARTGAIAPSSMSTAAPRRPQTVGHLRMEGKEVFQHAVGMVTDVIKACFRGRRRHRGRHRLVRAASGQPPHHRRLRRQARHRAARRWSMTVERHGNTSAASIPLALDGGVSRTGASSRAIS